MNHTRKNPLVTIIVVTYNSSKFVLETLYSAREQTYQNIEVIISDDGSIDGTVEICSKWIAECQRRFIRTELIKSKDNTGISANCSRGLNAAKGEWIKFIAGDDILHKDCISALINFILFNENARIVSSRSQGFIEVFSKDNFMVTRNLSKSKFFQKETSATKQFFMLLVYNYIDAPTTLINREFLINVGGFDVIFTKLEDLPLWLKITAMDYKIFFLNELTVYYRIHSTGTSRLSSSYSKHKNYLLLEHALGVFDKHNDTLISKQEKTILIRKYLSLLRQPFGTPHDKLLQFAKIIKYWPGIHHFIYQKKIINNFK